MQWVNAKTGEVYEVEETDLANACEGDLNRLFKNELRKLVSQMQPKSVGAVNIKVKVTCDYDADLNVAYIMEADISTKYPKVTVDDLKPKRCLEDGTIAQAKERGLFTDGD